MIKDNSKHKALEELVRITLEYNKPFREVIKNASQAVENNESTNILKEIYKEKENGRK